MAMEDMDMENQDMENQAPEDTVKVYGGMTARGLVNFCAQKGDASSVNMACYQIIKAAQDMMVNLSQAIDSREEPEGVPVDAYGFSEEQRKDIEVLKDCRALVDYAKARLDVNFALVGAQDGEKSYDDVLETYSHVEGFILWANMRDQLARLHEAGQLKDLMDDANMTAGLRQTVRAIVNGGYDWFTCDTPREGDEPIPYNPDGPG